MQKHLLPEVKPDFEGRFATAWECNLDSMRKIIKNPDDATVAFYIVYAPRAHPWWYAYAISLVHLRPIKDSKRPPIINKVGATHEVMVYALDPDFRPSLTGLNQLLIPANFIGQMICESDDAAQERVLKDVKDICNGILNPDTDARHQWVARYGDEGFKPEFRETKGRA